MKKNQIAKIKKMLTNKILKINIIQNLMIINIKNRYLDFQKEVLGMKKDFQKQQVRKS